MSLLAAAIQSLTPSAELEFYELDTTALGGGVHYFHCGTNGLGGSVVWQGRTYQPMPIKADGFEVSGQGTLPRPKLTVSNIDGLVGALVRNLNDLRGAVLTRRRTLARFLDAVNFPGGVNPTANPTEEWDPDVYRIDRKTHEDSEILEFELASALDMDDFQLPAGQILPICSWVYRSAECTYTGGPCAKADDTPTSDPALDRCGGRLASCKLRFGATAKLPFGGFPGANSLRNA